MNNKNKKKVTFSLPEESKAVKKKKVEKQEYTLNIKFSLDKKFGETSDGINIKATECETTKTVKLTIPKYAEKAFISKFKSMSEVKISESIESTKNIFNNPKKDKANQYRLED